MRILVHELICAGGLDDPPPSLRREGWAMLSAIATDFAAINGVEVSTLLAPAFQSIDGVRRLESLNSREQFEEAVGDSDAVLIVAPEFDGRLIEFSDIVGDGRRERLGCSADAIRLAGDKCALAEHWRERGVPTPATCLAFETSAPPCPAVLKPRFGAGSQATRLIESAADWPEAWREASREIPDHEFIVQPYRPGKPCSIAFLIGPKDAAPLLPGEQILSTDGRFHYRGGRFSLSPDEAHRAVAIGRRAIAGIPGLAGCVGVDLVLGEQDVAIEINPRLTTSYIGLRRMTTVNLAEAWLRLHRGEPIGPIDWRKEPLAFSVDSRDSS